MSCMQSFGQPLVGQKLLMIVATGRECHLECNVVTPENPNWPASVWLQVVTINMNIH